MKDYRWLYITNLNYLNYYFQNYTQYYNLMVNLQKYYRYEMYIKLIRQQINYRLIMYLLQDYYNISNFVIVLNNIIKLFYFK
jgi:hypothetical protein